MYTHTHLYSIFYGGRLHCLKAFHNATCRTTKAIEKNQFKMKLVEFDLSAVVTCVKCCVMSIERSCQYTFYVMFKGLVTNFRASLLVLNMLVQTR